MAGCCSFAEDCPGGNCTHLLTAANATVFVDRRGQWWGKIVADLDLPTAHKSRVKGPDGKDFPAQLVKLRSGRRRIVAKLPMKRTGDDLAYDGTVDVCTTCGWQVGNCHGRRCRLEDPNNTT